jgi:hypothetical protein
MPPSWSASRSPGGKKAPLQNGFSGLAYNGTELE